MMLFSRMIRPAIVAAGAIFTAGAITMTASPVQAADDLPVVGDIRIDMPRVRVLHHDIPFNWSELNNLACQTGIHPVDTPQILFLNDDIELLSPDTIDQLQAHLAFDEKIGAVGALLHYPESEGGGVQHEAWSPIWNGLPAISPMPMIVPRFGFRAMLPP